MVSTTDFTRVDTTTLDLNKDGIVDQTTVTITDVLGGYVAAQTTYDVGTLYPHSTISQTLFEYDAAGQNTRNYLKFDWNGDYVWDETTRLDRIFDGDGHVIQEIALSPDFNGDGVIGDYTDVTTYTENFAGSLTEKKTQFFYEGGTNPSDYLLETWTYAADGQKLLSYAIDDPWAFDCVITRTNTYNAAGQLANIKEQNEIRYGDERARIDESYTYNKDGTMKTKTDWADYSDKGWFQRVDTYFTWKDGYDSQKIDYDKTGDWKPEAKKLVEHWYNDAGQLTHTLVSHDDDGKGGPLAGGFDRRDLTVATWEGDHKVAEYIDLGNDGIIDVNFTSVDMDLLVA